MLLYLVCTSQQMQCMFLLTYSDKAVFCALVLRRLLSPLLQRFFLRLNILIKEDKSVGSVSAHNPLLFSISSHLFISQKNTHAPCLTSLEYTYTLYKSLITTVQNSRTLSIYQLISLIFAKTYKSTDIKCFLIWYLYYKIWFAIIF